MLLCVLLMADSLGNSFGIGYSVVQAQQEAQQPSTLTYDSPLSNKLSTADPGNTPDHNAVISSSQTFTNSKKP